MNNGSKKLTARQKRQAYRRAHPKKRGAPIQIPYLPQYALQARHIAGLGATNQQIAKIFNIDIATFHKWTKDHPEFISAIKEGRDDPDNRVEASLFHKALSGDVTACIFWLKCRRPYVWRDRRSGEEAEEAGNDIRSRLAGMTSEQLRKIVQGKAPSRPVVEVQTKQIQNGH